MGEYVRQCMTGANLPATVLLLLVLAYWALVILGAFQLDFLDFDLDLDGQPDSLFSAGFVGLRFLNLGRVPLMIWVSVFALSLWLLSMLLWLLYDRGHYGGGWWSDVNYLLRNGLLAVVLTKLLTQPLRGLFSHDEQYTVEDLIGQQCTVTTSRVDGRFGRARYETDGAPLLLDVRAEEGEGLVKGDCAQIVDYDPQAGTYLIAKANRED